MKKRSFRMPATEASARGDVEEEIVFHIESRVAELVAAGIDAASARRQAEREFGDVGEARTELTTLAAWRARSARRGARRDAIVQELRLSVRGLLRSPGYASAVVLVLALGIGVNAAMFGLTDRLLLSPPAHVRDGDRLVRVMYQHTPEWEGVLRVEATMPYADYAVQRSEVAAFAGVAAYTQPQDAALGRGESAAELRVSSVTGGYFAVLGVDAVLGRVITEADDADGSAARVVVLSDVAWRSHFGRSPEVLGRLIEIGNATYEVIGVAPRGFIGIDLDPVEAWVPVSSRAPELTVDWRTTRAMAWLRVIARLADGVTAEAAAAESSSVYLATEAYAPRYDGDATARIVLGSIIAARAPAVGQGTPQRSGRIALWLLAVSGVVLVVACVNVAGLMLARSLRRRRELGVRLALGVSRRRLAMQVVAESSILALAGGALGLLFAHWSGRVARLLLLPGYDWTGTTLDARVFLFASACALLAALATSVIPALHAAREDAVRLIGGGARGATSQRSRLRSGLVAVQAMLAVLLLVGAGLFVRSLDNARHVHLGFDPERVLVLDWQRSGLDWSSARTVEIYERSLERLLSLPEVESAALAMSAPMYSAMGATVRVPGRDSVPRPPGMFGFLYNAVSPEWFATMGTRVLRGRALTDADIAGAAPVAVVTQRFADWVWPGEEAIGRCFMHGDGASAPCREVVGIVEDFRYRNVEDPVDAIFFLPLAQGPSWPMRVLSVRPHGDALAAIPALRRALHDLDAELPHVSAELLRHRIDPQLQPWRLGASLFAGFGVLALMLAAIGLYGVVAYDVSQRTRELGVRYALGARARNIAAMVLRDALRIVAVGLVLGLALAWWLAPRAETLLFGIAPREPATFGGVVIVLLVAGAAAALLPGLRAARVQPVEALRHD